MDLEKITSDRLILDLFQVYQIPFFRNCPELFTPSCKNGERGSLLQVDQVIQRKSTERSSQNNFIQAKSISGLNIFSPKERYRASPYDKF